MGIFSRLFNIGKAEVNSAIDKFEDPIKLTEQGIRNLKKDLDGALKGLAEVKAIAIRTKRDMENAKNQATNYEKKAMLILQKGSNGQLDGNEADRLAKEALMKKESAVNQSAEFTKQYDLYSKQEMQLDAQVKKLKSEISHYENELKTLKARVKVSETTKKLNKQIAQIDPSGTISMLERMKEKVDQEEALAEAYGEMANEAKSIDEEIDKAVADSKEIKADDSLAALKAKMGLSGSDSSSDSQA